MRVVFIIFVLFMHLVAPAAHAIDVHRIFTHKQWALDLVVFEDGRLSCRAESLGRPQSLAIWSEGDGRVEVQWFDPMWELRERDARVRIDVDYERWHGTARLHGGSVFITIDAPEFLMDLVQGRAAALYSGAGVRLGTVSLAGSAAVIRKMPECVERLGYVPTDPFGAPVRSGNPTDPFGSF